MCACVCVCACACVTPQAVELSDCEQTQALALQVLLSLAKYNQHRIHEMDCCHGYSMIHQVLIKAKCIVGYHMLKVRRVACTLGDSVRRRQIEVLNSLRMSKEIIASNTETHFNRSKLTSLCCNHIGVLDVRFKYWFSWIPGSAREVAARV